MLNQQTVEKLKELKLEGMAQAFREQLEQPVMQELSFEERLGMLVLRESTMRENRRPGETSAFRLHCGRRRVSKISTTGIRAALTKPARSV